MAKFHYGQKKCDWNGVFMITKKGLYVFPQENGNFKMFTYDGTECKQLPDTTFALQLINFLEVNLTPVSNILSKFRDYNLYTDDGGYDFDRANMIIQGIYAMLAREFYEAHPEYSFLLSTEMENRIQGTMVSSNWDLDRLRERAVSIIDSMLVMSSKLYKYTYAYASLDEPHEKRVINAVSENPQMVNRYFTEFILTSPLDTKMFTTSEISYPFHRGYFFDRLEDFLWFIFLNSLQYDVNLCICKYCGHFFIPSTSKKTWYCDRVRTEDGKTCKQVGPPFIRKYVKNYFAALGEYDKAMERNFKRAERTENRVDGTETPKSLSFNEYISGRKKFKRQSSNGLRVKLPKRSFLKLSKSWIENIPTVHIA